MTGQPLNPQNNDPDITEILDIKPKNTFLSGLQGKFKSSRVPKVGKPVMPKPTPDRTADAKVPLSRPTKRLPKEPGQAPRVAKPGLALATTAQQRKLIPMVGVFLLLGAVSLYVNFSNASTEKPVTAFVMPGPGQPGYIPAPGTMNTTPTGSALPGAASNTAGFTTPAQTPTSGAPGTPPAIPGTPPTSTTNPGGVVISTSAPPTATSATTPGNTTKTTGTATKGSANPADTTTRAAQVAKTGKGTPAAAIPGAPGSKATPTDVLSEPVIPDVFAVADDKNAGGTGGTGGTGSAGASGNGNATGSTHRAGNGNAQGTPSGVNVTTAYAPPAALRNVPLAPVPRQVQVAVAAPMSIQSLPAPTPVTPPPAPQVRSVPTLSAVPVPLPRSVQMTPVPQPVSLPLQAPITARPATGVTLTPGATAVTSAPAAAPSVVLVGTASGDTPTAILSTPAGQMIAGIGDHVTVNDLDYTISKINAKSVTMTHLKDTLTLTEIN